jgi:hypothetical protein
MNGVLQGIEEFPWLVFILLALPSAGWVSRCFRPFRHRP